MRASKISYAFGSDDGEGYSASFEIDSSYCAYTTASNQENVRLFGGHGESELAMCCSMNLGEDDDSLKYDRFKLVKERNEI